MFRSVFAIARNTFTDLVRQKVFYMLLLFGLVAVGSSIFMAKLISFQEQFQMLKDVCLGAMSVFTSLLAILATASFLSRDLEDRTIYTLLSKPVPRASYLLGKLAGIVGLIFLFVVLMAAMSALMLWLRQESVLAETRAQMTNSSPEDLKNALNEILQATFNINLVAGVLIIFIKAALLASLTLLISTFATSSLFTVIMAVAVYFIGHLQATAREYWLQGVDLHWWSQPLIAVVALMFPDLQAFNITDDIIAGAAISWAVFLKTFALGWVYVVVYYLIGAFIFSGREL